VRGIGKPAVRPCWHCGTFERVLYWPAMTAYAFDGEVNSDEDPNRDHEMCVHCYYSKYWQEKWDEYRSSQGV
jgi:hypothetical protein